MDIGFLSNIGESLEADADLRIQIQAAVKRIEILTREIQSKLNSIHSADILSSQKKLDEVCVTALKNLNPMTELLNDLESMIPNNQYYRYNDQFSRQLQQLVYLIALINYLRFERILLVDDVKALLGVQVDAPGTFHIPIEDYLHGLISLTNDLARLAVTSVISGDYQRPLRISKFVDELYNGFQMISFKNDSLRKRFDSMKYDVKKIEEIVLNISLRKLV